MKTENKRVAKLHPVANQEVIRTQISLTCRNRTEITPTYIIIILFNIFELPSSQASFCSLALFSTPENS